MIKACLRRNIWTPTCESSSALRARLLLWMFAFLTSLHAKTRDLNIWLSRAEQPKSMHILEPQVNWRDLLRMQEYDSFQNLLQYVENLSLAQAWVDCLIREILRVLGLDEFMQVEIGRLRNQIMVAGALAVLECANHVRVRQLRQQVILVNEWPQLSIVIFEVVLRKLLYYVLFLVSLSFPHAHSVTGTLVWLHQVVVVCEVVRFRLSHFF